jgi:hypothetical protein
VLDENEFLSPARHPRAVAPPLEHPFTFEWGALVVAGRLRGGRVRPPPLRRQLELARGRCGAVNVMIVRALGQFYSFYGDDFRVECPTGSGNMLTLFEVSQEIMQPADPRPSGAAADGRRPSSAARDPAARSPTGAITSSSTILPRRQRRRPRGSHQTGWTGVIARLIQDPQRGTRRARAGRGPARRRHGRRSDGRPGR